MAAASAATAEPASTRAGGYIGRFAPTPSGPLHAGSLVAALASWLDARAHGGQWRLRIDDLDAAREVAGAADAIVAQLERCGLRPDGAVVLQSANASRYEAALHRLVHSGNAYPCGCSRRDLAAAPQPQGGIRARNDERIYPGTCRDGLGGKPARSWRLRTDASGDAAAARAEVAWTDRRLGPQHQDVAREVGDFVLRRADGAWAYQLAVVVDDADAGITDVVRGEDLAGNTSRQIVLQRRLGLPTPRYLHTPLVRGEDGQKLSKQNGATALDLTDPLSALRSAGSVLGLDVAAGRGTSAEEWLASAVDAWRQRMPA
ncbi:MAG: tRNA glutamyl-Q(34) synthetase GluQRS [Caldimonas sp.]